MERHPGAQGRLRGFVDLKLRARGRRLIKHARLED